MTTALVLLGLCAGFGLVLAAAGLAVRQPSLAEEMARFDRPALETTSRRPLAGRGPMRTFTRVERSVEQRLVPPEKRSERARDLAVTDRTLERHLVVMAVTTLLGTLAPLVVAGVLAAAGWRLPLAVVPVAAALGAVAGVVATAVELRRSAARARHRFLGGLSCWLELVALGQAGGMGVESALDAATRISPDPTFSRIGQALQRSRHAGLTPWDELGRLGTELGIQPLDELAASLGLAGAEGARIRASLQAKSASLRRRQMSQAQSQANSVTERLFLPSIVLMLGFLVFVMFPAGVSLAHVL
ncbi:MAG: type II secretion system F family protein [Acidimicrobiales bacterium]